jgi:hypothetical protein
MFRPSKGVIFSPCNYESNIKVIGFTPACRDLFGIVFNQAYNSVLYTYMETMYLVYYILNTFSIFKTKYLVCIYYTLLFA